ncbi:non-ribosomal peptide synthetase [Streptomyces yaizuensis]|uniref:Amino acid adenylation domain-containing protein n=1 Tax=Streptomyces yaizuensis TaxID=2989713 RepID=A0ABQ5NQT3_9ACTN|nr:non-ribosomal peptide synthetase [Streptomyces sp. YSPA8]GLF92744.1 amino acid adenylation domain-containing protein [Streptomyces sp. YSPA8]
MTAVTLDDLLTELGALGVELRREGDALKVRGPAPGPALVAALREHKTALLGRLDDQWWAPPRRITPAMLPLVALEQRHIDAVVATVDGGAAQVQDIYPLAPLQEGVLFHHLTSGAADPYLMSLAYACDTRERLDAFLAALQAVVDRHDILRTAVVWEGLPEPVQVVWRSVTLPVTEITAGPRAAAGEDRAARVRALADPRRLRLDPRRAPLAQVVVAPDGDPGREDGWLAVLLLHHLVADHVTLEVVHQEIGAHLAGTADRLPVPVPFRTFVARVRLTADTAAHEAFFTTMLGGTDEPTAPYGLLRAGGDGTRVTEARRRVDPDVAARLRERARTLGVSTAALAHLAWAQVLARLTGRDDVVFGTVLSGRLAASGDGADRAVGPFINTLPLRVDTAPDPSTAARATHRLLTGLLAHEHASLALAQRCGAVPAPAPLFTTLLNYRYSAPAQDHPWPGIRPVHGEERTNYPLTLSVDDLGTGFGLTVQATAPLDPERIRDYAHAALAAVADPAAYPADILPPDELHTLVHGFNPAPVPVPEPLVHERIAAHAADTPDAPAVVHGDTRLTYGELDRRANRLAHYLRALGVRPDDRVGVRLDRGTDMIVALLAVLKAGGGYVPLDPAYPPARLAWITADTAPVAVVDDALLADADLARRPDHAPARDGLLPGHLAYVIHTSGSTGRPKGVMVEHAQLRHSTHARNLAYPHVRRFLLLSSLSFDSSVAGVFGTLTQGATLVIATDPRDPRAVAADIARHDIDTLLCVPSLHRALLDEPDLATRGRCLRTVVVAGEVCPPDLVTDSAALLPDVAVVNEYGPTEATVWATAHLCVPDGAPVPIGTPVANTRVYVLDQRGRPAPTGVAGELVIGGPGVARGYLGGPALTAERFAPDPFVPGARVYRTGDRARHRADGTLEFLGRLDHQVKIRGHRVEPGEIEAVLAPAAGAGAVAVAVHDGALVAYVTGDIPTDRIRAEAAAHLPAPLVPTRWVRLDALPLGPGGKLDRAALPAPSAAGPQRGPAPVGELEHAVAALWADVLGVDRVGRHDDFFHLGGHSLTAMRATALLRSELGLDTAVSAVFDTPVLADYARAVAATGTPAPPPITPVPRGRTLEPAPGQRRLWLLSRLDGADRAHRVRMGLRLTGDLDESALRRALDAVVARHEILRTTFTDDGALRIAPPTGFPWTDDLEAPFDLNRGPLLRGRLTRGGEKEWELRLAAHHIVFDGWSAGVLVRELDALYNAFAAGRPDPLPPLPVQYADHAAWQRSLPLDTQADHWRAALTGAPAICELPTDRPRPAQRDFAGAFVELAVEPALADRVEALSRRHGCTLFVTLLAGWATVLTRLSGQSEVVVGTPTAGRTRTETDDLIGFFVNMLALRLDTTGDPTTGQWLRRVRERVVAAQTHQDLPFEQVVELVAPARSAAYAPLFQHAVTWQTGTGAARPDLAGVTAEPLPPDRHDGAAHDLTLALARTEDGAIHGGVEYATALFDRATVERLLGHWRTVLTAMADDDTTPLSRLPLLTAAERDRLIALGTGPRAVHPPACLPDLFEAQAARTPDAVAVEDAGHHLTYAELDARANRVAHHLRGLGTGPDDRVGISVPPGTDMVVAVLGVLKAGGAYVPLDPAAPAARNHAVAAEATPVTVLDTTAVRRALDGQGPDTAPDRTALRPDHLAYTLFTSGTTGTPKGVLVEHAAIVAATRARARVHGSPGRCVLAVPLAFDASAAALFGTLTTGGTLVVAPPDPAALPGLLRERRVETLICATSALLAVLPVLDAPALRRVVVGGDTCPPGLAADLARSHPRAELVNEYGPTEATIWATYHRCAPGETDVPIGRPIENVRVYVLDPHGEPVPEGTAGELCVAGAGLARGYLGSTGPTAERFPGPFVSDPFVPGARMYRTGDRARWRSDGTLAHLGRLDDQLKIRGIRVEPGEIETRLREHPAVRQAVVTGRDGALVAYHTGTAAPEELRAHLARSLPDHLLPGAYVRLDTVPLTPHGKADRAALPEPGPDAYLRQAWEAPDGPVETALAAVWADVLGQERIGRNDNFFDLGGHSLIAVTVLERLRERGLATTLTSVFTAPTLRDLAETVLAAPGERPTLPAPGPDEIAAVAPAVDGGADNVQDVYPLAPLQQGVLFHHLMPDQALPDETDPYLTTLAFPYDSRERVDATLAALQRVIDRHDILRTAVVWENLPEPRQVVWRRAALPVTEAAGPGDITAVRRIDIRRAPLLRVSVAPDGDRWLLGLHLHHLVGDHGTLDAIGREVAALVSGEGNTLPPPVPFRDFVAHVLTTADPAGDRAFFTDLLGDVDAPTDPYGLRATAAPAEHRAVLPPALTGRLRAAARRLSVSPAALWHLAWGLVLARLTGRRDVVFGTVLLGRSAATAGALGPFINTLPVRLTVDGTPAATAVRNTQALLAELLRREHASLADAQRCSGVPAPAPLFTSLLNYRHDDSAGQETPQGTTGPATAAPVAALDRTNYPLTVSVDESPAAFALTVQAPRQADPARIAGYLHTAATALTDALAGDGSVAVVALDAVPVPVETGVVSSRVESCVHEVFEARVASVPGAVAVVDGGVRVSYGELNARANRVAHDLLARGVVPDDLVAVRMERGADLIAALLGVLKAGAAYVPVDPSYPVERQELLLADCRPVAVVDTIPEDGPAHDPVGVPVRPDHLASVIHTSGSSGRPKGVLVEHRQVVRLFTAAAGWFDVGPDDVWSFFHSFAFDFSVWEVFGALLSGGSVVVVPGDTARSPEEFHELVCAAGVTVLSQTPGAFGRFLAARESDPREHRLRYVVFGGEALDVGVLRPWFAREADRDVVLVNMYGITETTVHVTAREITPADLERSSSPIGVRLPDLRTYVLDHEGRPSPVGVAGELYVGGAGVARGYLNRPDLTGERFLDDPFVPGERVYRTGDVVRWSEDGELEYVGRNDSQVKVRGYRVEPGEIESVLLRQDGVREAVVVARDDTLVAYVTGDASTEDLRPHLVSCLPSHMVPSAYVLLESLPLTSNGKLDRAALPAPDGDAYVRGVYEEPRGPVERALAEIWSDLLGVDRVGRHDDFFALGGHSLLAVRALSRLRTRWDVDISLGTLFTAPALTDWARTVAEATASTHPPIVPVPRTGPLPMSFAQRRLWFLSQLDGVSEAYHIPLRLRLTGDLDEEALRRALDTVVSRHEALRTTFAQEGEPVQRIAPRAAFAWGADEGPFDLVNGPLIRGGLTRTGEREWALTITMHHIVSDGWSLGILAGEIRALYTAYRAGRPDPLPPLTVQYADYALWQRDWVSGEELKRQADFWQRTLAGAPERCELPTDRPRPAHQDIAGGAVACAVGPELTERLRALAARHGLTLYMTVLAAWAALITRVSGQDEVVIGTPSANRGRPETEGLIGFFVNMLPLRLDLSDSPSVAAWLARVKAVTLAAQDHQDLPFEQVVDLVRPTRSLAHNAVFQVALAWQTGTGTGTGFGSGSGDGIGDRLDLPGITAEPLGGPAHTTSRFDLTLSLAETDDGIRGGAEYATSLFDRTTVERLLGHWRTLLTALADADDTTPVDRLPLLTGAERDRIVREWNDTAADLPPDCLHRLVEAQVARTPDAVAVIGTDRDRPGEQLTYAGLDARANGLAHRLAALGVRPGDRVAVALERGTDQVAAVLGVLKSGAAYVPLDPAHPADRLRTVVTACEAVAVVTAPDGGPDPSAWAGRPVLHPAMDGPATAPPTPGLTPDSLAYVIYTSGSTGTPKGVMISHAAACNTLLDINTRHQVGPDDAVLAVSSLTFDLSVYDLFGVLAAGGRVVLLPPGRGTDPARWHELVTEHRITLWDSVPALAQLFVDSAPDPARFPSVRLVMMSGDWIPVDLPGRIRARCPRAGIHSYGGATEAAIWSVSHPVGDTGPADRDRGSVPYGGPLANQTVYVLDPHGEPCPVGVAGDLFIGGAGVALGYLGRPDLTAERFLDDPFAPGGRMYLTGDRVRWLTDGVLEFLGRSDFQVKIRGFRIELGEIESLLLRHPGVREAVALAREDTPGDRRLVAYTVGPAGPEELRAHLAAGLPDYMRPAAHVVLDALPLTANGKLDRRALPAPEGGGDDGDRPYDPPRGATETAIAGIWSDLLGVERPGRHDNFFQLGGHSLLAVTLLDRMRAQGLETDVRALFTASTLAALAEVTHDIQEIRL